MQKMPIPIKARTIAPQTLATIIPIVSLDPEKIEFEVEFEFPVLS